MYNGIQYTLEMFLKKFLKCLREILYTLFNVLYYRLFSFSVLFLLGHILVVNSGMEGHLFRWSILNDTGVQMKIILKIWK